MYISDSDPYFVNGISDPDSSLLDEEEIKQLVDFDCLNKNSVCS